MSFYTFKWPAGPKEVIITGTFDSWSKSLPLVKQADGSFEITVPLPKSDSKIYYKYIVDGEWLVSDSQKKANDESGNENNVVDQSELVLASSKSVPIPESGLALNAATGAAAAGAVAAGVAASSGSKDLKTTVLPKEEPSHPTIAGEPGVVIPKNPEAIAAFKEVSTVDPKSLNGEGGDVAPAISAEEKKKQKKKVKKSKYKAKKKQQKNGALSSDDVSAGATPEPEKAVATPAAVAAASTAIAGGAAAAGAGSGAGESVETPAPTVDASLPAEAKADVSDIPEPNVAKEVVPESSGIESVATDASFIESAPVSTPKATTAVATTAVPVGGAVAASEIDQSTGAEAHHTLDPKAQHPEPTIDATAEDKEVTAIPEAASAAPVVTGATPAVEEPVSASVTEPVAPLETSGAPVVPPAASDEPVIAHTEPLAGTSESGATKAAEDEEIIITKGVKNPEEIIAAQEGKDVVLEEIRPTESEAKKLQAQAAKEQQPATKAAKGAAALAKKDVAKATAAVKEEKEKKKGGFWTKVKKIFK